MANVSSSSANVAVELYDDAGVMIGGTTLPLYGMGHTRFTLSDKFPAAAGRRGTLILTVPNGGQIAAMGFRSNAQGSLTVAPPLAPQSEGAAAAACRVASPSRPIGR